MLFRSTDRATHRRYTPGFAARSPEGIEHRAVVCAVTGGLYHHIFIKAQVITQRKKLCSGRITRGVFALWRVRKLRAWTKDVAVGVNRTGRQMQMRSAGPAVPVEPAGGF